MGRWLALWGVLCVAGCAEPPPPPVPRPILDAGPPLEPLAPRRVKPAPACEPTWRLRIEAPPDALGGVTEVGDRLAFVGWGVAAVSDEDRWIRADASNVPEVGLASSRQIVFSDALEFEGDVYAVGTRMTILRFDGAAWHLEHQDLGLSPRATHAATLEVCDGRLRALAFVGAWERADDGTWTRLGRGRWSCAPELRTQRPDEPCGRYYPGDRIVHCRAGVRVFSERASRWYAVPDGVRYSSWRRDAVVEHEGGLFFLADEQLLHTADGREWTAEQVGASPIDRIFASNTRVHAVTEDAVYVRDLCP